MSREARRATKVRPLILVRKVRLATRRTPALMSQAVATTVALRAISGLLINDGRSEVTSVVG